MVLVVLMNGCIDASLGHNVSHRRRVDAFARKLERKLKRAINLYFKLEKMTRNNEDKLI